MIQLLQIILFSQLGFSDIYRFSDRDIHLSLGMELQEYLIDFENTQYERELSLTPNLEGLVVPKISYKDLFSLSYAFELPVAENEIYLRGKTKYTDLRFLFNFQNLRINFYYLQYLGFFFENSELISPSYGGTQPEILRPQLYSRSYGGDVTWVKDKATFSLSALTTMVERQESSGGSLLLGASGSESHFENPNEIIPIELANEFGLESALYAGKFQTIAAKFGYGYTYVYEKKWFLGGALQLGPGLTSRELRYLNVDSNNLSEWGVSLRVEGLISLGYNGDVFYWNLNSEMKRDSYFVNNDETTIGLSLLTAGLTFGVHLEEIGF